MFQVFQFVYTRCCFRRETFITVPSAQLPQMEEEEEEAELRTPARLNSDQGEEDVDVSGTS